MIQKHWFFFVVPIVIGTLLLPVFGIGLLVYLWAFLRYKFDKVEIKDGQLYSRLGLINIDTKTIPLNKISMVSVKSDIFSELLGFGVIQVQSSAFNSTISYPYIKDAKKAAEIINEQLNCLTAK